MGHLQFCHWVTEWDPDDGPSYSRRTVVGFVPTTLILYCLMFLQVSTDGHMRRTVVPTTVHPAQLFWLSETLFLRVSLYFSKCSQTDNYDGPSYPRRSVLHNHYTFQRLSSMVLHINKVYVRHDRPHGPSYSRRAVTWPFVFRCYYRNVITS